MVKKSNKASPWAALLQDGNPAVHPAPLPFSRSVTSQGFCGELLIFLSPFVCALPRLRQESYSSTSLSVTSMIRGGFSSHLLRISSAAPLHGISTAALVSNASLCLLWTCICQSTKINYGSLPGTCTQSAEESTATDPGQSTDNTRLAEC